MAPTESLGRERPAQSAAASGVDAIAAHCPKAGVWAESSNRHHADKAIRRGVGIIQYSLV